MTTLMLIVLGFAVFWLGYALGFVNAQVRIVKKMEDSFGAPEGGRQYER